MFFFFFSSRRRHTSFSREWSSDVCSSDLHGQGGDGGRGDFPAQRQQGREAKVRRRSEGTERRFHVQAHPRGLGLGRERDDEGVRQEKMFQRCWSAMLFGCTRV